MLPVAGSGRGVFVNRGRTSMGIEQASRAFLASVCMYIYIHIDMGLDQIKL